MKLLIIDDSEVMRELLKACIKEVGFELAGEAVDGEEGINKYKELNPDLVLLDITMPKMDGLDCLKNIKEYDENAKVVMVTSMSAKGILIETMKLGALDYILKPFEDSEVIQKLKDIKKHIQ